MIFAKYMMDTLKIVSIPRTTTFQIRAFPVIGKYGHIAYASRWKHGRVAYIYPSQGVDELGAYFG